MKKNSLLLLLFLFEFVNSQVGIRLTSETPATTFPDNSAVLEVYSTSKGVLLPRVSLGAITNSVLPVASPQQGMIIYNDSPATTPRALYYWDNDPAGTTSQYNRIYTFPETLKTANISMSGSDLAALNGAGQGTIFYFTRNTSNPSSWNTLLSLDNGYMHDISLATRTNSSGSTHGIRIPAGNYLVKVTFKFIAKATDKTIRSGNLTSSTIGTINTNYFMMGYFCDVRYAENDGVNSTTPVTTARSETMVTSGLDVAHTVAFDFSLSLPSLSSGNPYFVFFDYGRATGSGYNDQVYLIPSGSFIKITKL